MSKPPEGITSYQEPIHPNRIEAMYQDMFNKGQFYWPQLDGSPISIDEWKQRALKRWEDAEREKREGKRK